MKKSGSAFPVVFSLVMFLCVLFLVWYLPAVQDRTFRINDTGISLEMSQGRERKQQYEYDQAAAAIPAVEAELERLKPLCDAAAEEVQALKDEKKKLREEKKTLTEQQAAPADAIGGSGNE